MCEQGKKNILQGKSAEIANKWCFSGFDHNVLQDYHINSIPFAYFWNGAILLVYGIFDHIKGHLDIVFLWPLYQIWLLWS